MASTPSNAPSSIILGAPEFVPASSAGWNRKRTRPESSSLMAASTSATPSRMAAWASCPQACMTPLLFDRYGMSFSSVRGRASISARRATVRPGRTPTRSAVTPLSVPPKPLFTFSSPRARRRSSMKREVSTSCQESSGCSWKRRRSAATRSATASARFRMVFPSITTKRPLLRRPSQAG